MPSLTPNPAGDRQNPNIIKNRESRLTRIKPSANQRTHASCTQYGTIAAPVLRCERRSVLPRHGPPERQCGRDRPTVRPPASWAAGAPVWPCPAVRPQPRLHLLRHPSRAPQRRLQLLDPLRVPPVPELVQPPLQLRRGDPSLVPPPPPLVARRRSRRPRRLLAGHSRRRRRTALPPAR